MKAYQKIVGVILLLLNAALSTLAQETSSPDSTGLPGDHFSLEGALTLFSKASNIEDFEKALNTESNAVNNLDLNQDGDIDYLRVVDEADGDAHALIIQAVVNEKEVQDVAVIGIEKNGNDSAVLEITGDEELYGEELIVEPADEKESGGKGGPSPYAISRGVVVNVWLWPGVRFIYGPTYRPWISPYRWAYYPVWWKPWRVHPWRIHRNRCVVFHTGFRVVHVHRVNRAYGHYRTHRVTSVHVHNHYAPVRENHKAALNSKKSNKPNAPSKVNRTTNKKGGEVKPSGKTTKQPQNNRAKQSAPKQGAKPSGAKGGKRK